LAHGADPDPVFPANGETPLHVVAANWDAALAEELVSHGADATRPRTDGRTYAVAELNGNFEVVEWLKAHGAPSELSDVDRLVAACSRGDRSAAEAILARHRDLGHEIGPEHYPAFYRAAERNDIYQAVPGQIRGERVDGNNWTVGGVMALSPSTIDDPGP
jgi:ankyrin repeat protein